MCVCVCVFFSFFGFLFIPIFFHFCLITKIKTKLFFQCRNPTAKFCSISKRRNRPGDRVASLSDVLIVVFRSFLSR